MRSTVLVICLLGSFAPIGADESVDYLRTIKPIFQARCYACHGVLKQEGGLRLDTAALAVKGGDSGIVMKPGDPATGSLLKRVMSTDEAERMPPEGEPLEPEQIAALKNWIVQGATAPADEQPERDVRTHWAFQTPVRPAIPAAKTGPDFSNPIDALIAASYQQHGLTPQPAADKRVWLRRVSLDLIGLPPNRDEVDAFLADGSPEAIDKVVDRLLESPHYGERWGRHWMDIWRYSDWWGLGEDARNSQKHIWHWRDWIVESLNADKGYDQMLREMLAADELYPTDPDLLRAGGFLSRQYFKFNRTSWLDETVEHTAKAMLGLTFNCAKCHDHKYDPFSQADYYRFRALFEPYQVRLDAVPGQIDFEVDGIPRPFDCNLDAMTYLHIRGDDRNPDKSRIMEPAFPAMLALSQPRIESVTLPVQSVQPGLRSFVVEAYLAQADQQIAQKRAEVEVAKKHLLEAERLEAMKLVKSLDENRVIEELTVVRDDFSAAKPDVWEIGEGNWTYVDGKLTQSQAGSVRAILRMKQLPPEDFEAKLKFVPTGGQTWKSVGITFDSTESNDFLAYLSAYAAGPKAQFTYKQGEYVYPPHAAQARSIELNQPYELTLRVRGTLVNISVNGEHSIAYRIPLPRQRGVMQLITFDATADFRLFELKRLPHSVALVEAKTGDGSRDAVSSVEQSKLGLVIAEKSLARVLAQPDSIRARSWADQAQHQQSAAENRAELARAATRTERIVAVAAADENVARAELDVIRAAADKKTALETKLTTARTALEAARKAVDESGDAYTPLRGAAKALESNLETEESRLKPFPAISTGRRTALSQWITDPMNPLTARVAVNHIWSRHFGRPLVATVFDFGRKGTAPTHPQLLDWLAVEFMTGGSHAPGETHWSMKHIHRLIVTSKAYGMTSSSSGSAAQNLERDADNQFYWRMNPTRMESQVVRDSLLHLAGDLDPTMAGRSIPISNEATRRRSLYFVHSNIEHQKFLSIFDDASVLDCYRRAESIVPQQALALENSPLANDMAKKIAELISDSNRDVTDGEFIRGAFLILLGLEPTSEEQAAVRDALKRIEEIIRQRNNSDSKRQARVAIVQALINHNDFVTVR